MAIILASASPRRKELLAKSVKHFDIIPADIDETVQGNESPIDYVERMAKEKSLAVWENTKTDIVIGCDTTVVLNQRIMGKPVDDEDAYDMLASLSDTTHQVLTSVYIKTTSKIYQHTEKVDVTFYSLTEADIKEYIATGEQNDKAGAYGIQGQGALFVKKIKGDYY